MLSFCYTLCLKLCTTSLLKGVFFFLCKGEMVLALVYVYAVNGTWWTVHLENGETPPPAVRAWPLQQHCDNFRPYKSRDRRRVRVGISCVIVLHSLPLRKVCQHKQRKAKRTPLEPQITATRTATHERSASLFLLVYNGRK